jgi:hypothetical protein
MNTIARQLEWNMQKYAEDSNMCEGNPTMGLLFMASV